MSMEKDKKGIQFQAITPGLGFHPFSDGLPYAPVSKAPTRPQAAPLGPRESGTGATAAGPASFVYPSPRSNQPAKPSVQTRTAPMPRVSVPVATPAPARKTVTQQTKPASPIQPQAFAEPTYGIVYLLKRIFAYSIDTVLNVSLLATGLSFALLNEEMTPDTLMNPGILLISVLFFVLFNWALVTAQEIAFGTSVGKRIFRLALQGSTSALFLRAFFFLPSIGFCGIGLFWGLFDSKKRCWHDLVVNVQPIEIAKL